MKLFYLPNSYIREMKSDLLVMALFGNKGLSFSILNFSDTDTLTAVEGGVARRLLRLFELLAVIVVRDCGSCLKAERRKIVFGVANSFLLWEREESLKRVIRKFIGRLGLLMAKSEVINSWFESLFRLRQLFLSLMTEETLLAVAKSRQWTRFGLLVTVEECLRFSDCALRLVKAGDYSVLELLLNERTLTRAVYSVDFLTGVRMLLPQLSGRGE